MVHQRVHTVDKPYTCNVCPASFGRRSFLTLHVRTHTGEKPYTCDVCSASFRRKDLLTIHTRIHTGERPYVCDVCSATFRRREYLRDHTLLHTGEKPHTCDVCSRPFRRKSHLRAHKCKPAITKEFPCSGKCNLDARKKDDPVVASECRVSSGTTEAHLARRGGEEPITGDTFGGHGPGQIAETETGFLMWKDSNTVVMYQFR